MKTITFVIACLAVIMSGIAVYINIRKLQKALKTIDELDRQLDSLMIKVLSTPKPVETYVLKAVTIVPPELERTTNKEAIMRILTNKISDALIEHLEIKEEHDDYSMSKKYYARVKVVK